MKDGRIKRKMANRRRSTEFSYLGRCRHGPPRSDLPYVKGDLSLWCAEQCLYTPRRASV